MIDPTDILTATLPVESPVLMRFSSSARIYSAVLQQDLLGHWTVTQSWGGRFNRRGGGQIRVVEDFELGLKMMHLIARQRERRGYQKTL